MCLPNGIIYINSNSLRLLSYSADKKEQSGVTGEQTKTAVKESSEFFSLFQAHAHRQQPCGSLSMHLSLSHYSQ